MCALIFLKNVTFSVVIQNDIQARFEVELDISRNYLDISSNHLDVSSYYLVDQR